MSNYQEMQEIARRVRIDALTMIYQAGSGHPGGSLSVADLLTYLYTERLRYDVARQDWPERDRLVLSKGHACPALYAVAAAIGLIPQSRQIEFRRIDGALQGHPHVGQLPFVETSTGSLGQGFSATLGMALGLRYQGIEANCYAILGDGELQEGQVWEAAMFAAHHRLHRLCAVIDYNKMQSDDLNANIMGLEPLADKWRAFGWAVREIDGHNFAEITSAFENFDAEATRPSLIIAHTIKGKGVPYMEGVPSWHGSVKLSEDNLRQALAALGCDEAAIDRALCERPWEVRA